MGPEGSTWQERLPAFRQRDFGQGRERDDRLHTVSHIDPAEPGDNVGYELPDRAGVGSVAEGGVETVAMQRCQSGEGRRPGAGERRHAITPREQGLDDGEAEAAGTTGDD